MKPEIKSGYAKTPPTFVERLNICKEHFEKIEQSGLISYKVMGTTISFYFLDRDVERVKREFHEYWTPGGLTEFGWYGWHVNILPYDEFENGRKGQAAINILERLRKSVWEYIAFRLKI